ncbi:MAG: lamin tail domain-containing protein, partial [Cyanobacteria bacterium J06555_3]
MSLFISEYIEGSGNNKAIELFNNSDSLIDLGANGYSLEFYFNGSDTAGTSIELTGTVDSNGVFVVADNDADAAILAQTDLTSNSSFFNGDDAIALLENGVVIDSIGQIGFDPGSEWGSGDISTQNNTLRRNSDITVGDSNPDDTFDPSLEWSGFPQDTFDDLGSFNGAGGGGGNSSSITINEVDADTPGSDSAEFIELFDGGTGNSSLNGLVAVLYNGNGDSSYAAFDLDGFSTDSNGFFVLGNEAVANVGLTFSNNTLQNGADAVALYQGDAADFPNGTVVTAEGLVDAIVYDTSDGDDSELLTALGQSTQFDEAANGNQDNESNSRVPDGTGSFITQAPTPGVSNEQTPPPVDNFVPIFNIQGAALVSPLNGSQVSTTGIVTAVESNGFYLQDPTGDNNTATADGIFVFTSSAPGVSVGDALEVAGTVSEFTPGGASSGNLSTTQISNANITTVSTGNTLPAAVIIGNGGRVPPTTSIDDDPSSFFNGDDAIALLENGVVIDSIGQIGFDPGSEWGSGDISTQNNTLRRNSDITVGDSNPDDTFDPSLEWSGFPQDTFDDLGSFNGAGGGGGNSSSITINEVDADTPGSDSAEFIELFDGGTGNSSLNGLVAVLYNGNGDSSYAAFDLDGFSTDSNGFFVLGNEAVANVGLTFSNNTLQNGADAVALYQGDAADFPNGTVVTAEGLVDAIVYDTSDGDDSELLTALGQSTQFDEAANGNQDNESNSRVPDGTGSFITQAPTPGVSNEQTPPPVDNFVPIFNIQGAALVSPLNGSQVSTTGIVTAVESNGFYLQDPTGDNNTATADGIFVFTSSAPGVSVGDALEVAGTVSEFTPGGASSGNLSTTQISNANITTVSTGNTLPAAVIIGNGGRVPPTTSIDDDPSSFFNGDDAIALLENGVVIDSIGQIG